MGAQSDSFTIEGEKTDLEIREAFDNHAAQCRYDYGHAGYTGTMAETPGVTIVKQTFASADEAYDYGDQNAQKWEDALACRYPGGVVVVACCSS